MSNFRKNKRGIELPFAAIIIIIILLVSAGVILWAVFATAPKAGEKSQYELCATSNRITVGVEHKTSEYVSPPRACTTIDKTSGNYQVPTKSYDQKEEGAIKEVRDMIKNCWYMWLEGSEPNMFRIFPGEKTCQICYRFRIKDSIGSLNLKKLADSMNELYYVSIPKEHNCDPPNGGEILSESKCELDGGTKIKDGPTTGTACCRKDIRYECENKGGKCSENPDGEYLQDYSKWACPEMEKKCYVKPENGVSYMQYITEFSALGGDLFIMDPDQSSGTPIESINYNKDRIYAITFVSPAKQYCGGILCKIQWFSDKTSVGYWFLQFVAGAGGPVRTFIRHSQEDNFALENVPNSIMLSSYDEAQRLGCATG